MHVLICAFCMCQRGWSFSEKKRSKIMFIIPHCITLQFQFELVTAITTRCSPKLIIPWQLLLLLLNMCAAWRAKFQVENVNRTERHFQTDSYLFMHICIVCCMCLLCQACCWQFFMPMPMLARYLINYENPYTSHHHKIIV